ncbi:hypothetical protein [Marinobacter metalliresistant]|uniref:Uncharacterized protein n=1 Tax=Marinobacter metalliresistant TaxID=2961995 RepID=A0ABZ2W233_9GAMM|tara:strand:- start:32 stop:400 length:369 start_codon:yes stop_codon:yes gene_type:complete
MRKLVWAIAIFFVCGFANAVDSAQKQIEDSIMNLTEKHPELKLIRVFETTTNNYVVEVRVPDTMELARLSSPREKNLSLTKKWSALVCTPEMKSIAKNFSIAFLSVRQVDSKGESYSTAICH